MNFKSSNKLFSWYYGSIIFIILIVGFTATIYTYKTVSSNTQKVLLQDVASVAVVFNKEELKSLQGSEEDLQNPVYLSLKEKLAKIHETKDQVQFVYFLGYRDSRAFFYLDSEPDTSEDYSPPGQVYEEATDLDLEMLRGLKNEGLEFSSDRWGSWLTSLVTIREGEKVVAVMGMDISSEKYFKNLYIYTAVPILSTLFVLSLFLIGFFLRKKEKEYLVFKEKLFSLATHELRSPLTAISWLTETMLGNKEKMSKEDGENMTQIHEKITKLLGSVNTLLSSTKEENISKITTTTKPTVLIFDCFGVICDPPLSNWYKNKSKKHNFTDEKLHEILRKFDLGEMSEDDIADYFSKYEGINLTKESIREEIDTYLNLDRTLVDVIEKLKIKGFKTILLSNANASFFERKIYKLYPEFKNLFNEIIISSDVGMVKPDKEIYIHTLEKVNAKPEECLFIDDSKTNIEAGEKLGIKGYIYTDSKSFVEYLKTLGINL